MIIQSISSLFLLLPSEEGNIDLLTVRQCAHLLTSIRKAAKSHLWVFDSMKSFKFTLNIRSIHVTLLIIRAIVGDLCGALGDIVLGTC